MSDTRFGRRLETLRVRCSAVHGLPLREVGQLRTTQPPAPPGVRTARAAVNVNVLRAPHAPCETAPRADRGPPIGTIACRLPGPRLLPSRRFMRTNALSNAGLVHVPPCEARDRFPQSDLAPRECIGDQTQPGRGRLLAHRRVAPRPRGAAVGRHCDCAHEPAPAVKAITGDDGFRRMLRRIPSVRVLSGGHLPAIECSCEASSRARCCSAPGAAVVASTLSRPLWCSQLPDLQ